jgi:hypothetical protein
MSGIRFGIACTVWLLAVLSGFCGNAGADEFPSNQVLAEQNVAIGITRFAFGSGLEKDANGKANGNGLELVKVQSWGSGFIVKSDGTIATNYHVAKRAMMGEAFFQEGSRYEIRNIKVYDSKNDLAILLISAQKNFNACQLGDANKVEPRDKVLAVGNPQNLGLNITEGSVSQVIRDDLKQTKMIRHTAPITSGNSGGSLYKGKEVIGVNASVQVNELFGGGTGFNNAIPINYVKNLLDNPEYNRVVALSNAFPTSLEAMVKKFKQFDATSGTVQQARQTPKGPKLETEPGEWSTKIHTYRQTDLAFVVESPAKDIVLVLIDAKGNLRGLGTKKLDNMLPLLFSSDYPGEYTLGILNYDKTGPAQFGLKMYEINW